MKNKVAYFYSDGDGMFTVGCNTIDEAIIAMQEAWDDDPDYYKEQFGNVVFSKDTIEESVYFTHRICHYYTIGYDAICGECGEPLKGKPWKTFTINLD
jgi:hypothetical protein